MNYFAHGRRYLNKPYFLAGTAVPDWLNVVNRRARARTRRAQPLLTDPDPRVAAVAAGIIQHHFDDRWFHQTAAFATLQLNFTVAIRDRLPPDNGFRTSFLGHILVELLLDAILIEEDVKQLDRYYAVIRSLDVQIVAHTVNRLVTQPADGLAQLLPRFSDERFLYDYLEDGKLLWRLNQVMIRLKLPPVPESLTEWFPDARNEVRQHATKLLTQPRSWQSNATGEVSPRGT